MKRILWLRQDERIRAACWGVWDFSGRRPRWLRQRFAFGCAPRILGTRGTAIFICNCNWFRLVGMAIRRYTKRGPSGALPRGKSIPTTANLSYLVLVDFFLVVESVDFFFEPDSCAARLPAF